MSRTSTERLEAKIDTAFWAITKLQRACQDLDLVDAYDDCGAVAAWLAAWEEAQSMRRTTQAVCKPARAHAYVTPF
jgi:hypothetical protein